MKKFLSYIIMAGMAVLGVASCAQKEMVMFDPSAGTAPTVFSYSVDDDGVYVEYSPGAFKMGFNEKIAPVHSLALVKAGTKVVSKTLVSKATGETISVSRAELCKALMTFGFQENDFVNISLVVRASMQDQAKDNGLNGYIDSQATIDIADYEIWLPTGDPYARYTEKSAWSLVGSFNGWGSDPDVEMLTNGSMHLAKGVSLAAGDEVKFRKDNGWDVNFGYADGVDSYVLGEEFAVKQDGNNIIIAEDGVYDFLLDPDGATAKIIKSVAPQEDPYAAYTEVSPWSVIGSFNSWGGDEEMVTNGTLHVCKNITFAAGDEFKFRKDASWDVNFGYADGVETYVLGEEFAVKQDGSNIIVLEDGAYDLILDDVNAKVKIIKTKAVTVDPYAAYTEVSPWSVIGSFNSWGDDYEMVTNGTLHVAKAIALNAGEEWKFRFEGSWTVNFGYADGVDTYELGVEFAMKQDGNNIIVLEDGVYDFILDPENATGKVIKSVATDAGDTPGPAPKPKAWSLIGTLEDSGWAVDYDLTNVSGDVWTIQQVFVREKDEFKIRADHDWAKSYGGPEENAESTYEEGNVYGVYQPTLGEAFTAGGKNIRIGAEGYYNVTFTYGDEPTILIEEYKEFPDVLYMIGEEFGNWNWDSEDVVEMTPVLHNPAWGANAEAQFWTVRYFSAGKGFKFNTKRSWGGDFWGLTTNDGFTESGGNCTVSEDGFYMVHVDFKNEKVHVEPARIFLVGDATNLGGDAWNEEIVEATEDAMFKAEGKVLKATALKGGNLRMYAASAIATSSAWTREFNIYDGNIVYRGTGGDLEAVAILANQVVTLDFNAGTGSIEGDGEAPAFKGEITVAGDYSGCGWSVDNDPKLQGKDGVFQGALVMIGGGFKFVHDGTWIGGTATNLTYALNIGGGDNMTIADGTYFWTVDLAAESPVATAVAITKVGLMGSFNGWTDELELTYNSGDMTYAGQVTLEANAQFKVRFNGDWSYALGGTLDKLSAYGGNIEVADAGTYSVVVDLNKGTVTLIPAN